MRYFSIIASVFVCFNISACNVAHRDQAETAKVESPTKSQNGIVQKTVTTAFGNVFQKLADGWKDLSTNIIWYDLRPTGKVTQYEADRFCRSHGWSLPSGYPNDANGTYGFPNQDSDFIVANSHGINEVLPDLKEHNFWSSSSMQPILNKSAYYYWGTQETHYYVTEPAAYNNPNADFTAVCISSPALDFSLNEPGFTEIQRQSNGRITFEYQEEAKLFCAKQGQRLPTPREYAKLAQSRGAKGILEVDDVNKNFHGVAPVGYTLVKTQTDGRIDNFYFNNQGYQKPKNDMEMFCFWTSAGNPDYPAPTWDYKVIFEQNSGKFNDNALYSSNDWMSCAIRCAK